MNNNVKNQHFIPKCYLKNFVISNENERANHYDKDKNIFEERNIRSIFSGKYYYDLKGEQKTEKFLGKIENKSCPEIKKIIEKVRKTDKYRFNENTKDILIELVVIMMLRTRSFDIIADDVKDEFEKKLFKKFDNNSVDENFDSIFIREPRNKMLLENHKEFMRDVDDYKICICINKTKFPFVLSDNPVVSVFNGFVNSNNFFFLPLSHDVGVAIFANNSNNKILNTRLKTEKTIKIIKSDDVVTLNLMQVKNMYKEMIITETHYKFLKEI